MASSTSAGKEVLAYCTACKMDLGHTIVAMTGDQIAKVTCKTCNKTHKYRTPKGVTEPTAKKKKKASKKKSTETKTRTIEAEWESLMAANKDVTSKPYSIKGSFAIGDKITHKTFGDGIVGKTIFPNKIEVVFKTEIKMLIHTGAPRA